MTFRTSFLLLRIEEFFDMNLGSTDTDSASCKVDLSGGMMPAYTPRSGVTYETT